MSTQRIQQGKTNLPFVPVPKMITNACRRTIPGCKGPCAGREIRLEGACADLLIRAGRGRWFNKQEPADHRAEKCPQDEKGCKESYPAEPQIPEAVSQ